MPAFVIARFDITKPEEAATTYPRYIDGAKAAPGADRIQYLARGGTTTVLEGEGRQRNVIMRFADMGAVREWFDSDAYQAASRYRKEVAVGEMVAVQGMSEFLEPPPEPASAGGKKGYWIARVDVKDHAAYKTYIEQAAPAFETHRATFLARGGQHDPLEGAARARNVLIEFPTAEQAIQCYNSKAYQQAHATRHDAADADIVVVEGA